MNPPSTSSRLTTGILRGGALKPSWNNASATDDDSSLSDHGNGYKMTLQQLIGGGVGTVSPVKGHGIDAEQLNHSLRRWKSMDVEKEDTASVVSKAPRRRVVGRTKSQTNEDLPSKISSPRRRMPRRTRSFDDSTPFGMERPSTFITADPDIEMTVQIIKQELIQNGDSVRGLSALISSMTLKEEGKTTSGTIQPQILKVEDDSSESGFESLVSTDDFDILIDDEEEEHKESLGPGHSKQYNRSEKTLPLDDVLLMPSQNADSFEAAKSEEIVFDTNTKSVEITFDSKGKSEEFKASALFMDSDPSLDSHEEAHRYPNHLFSGKPQSEVKEVAELQESLRRWKTLDLPSATLGVQGGNSEHSAAKTPMKLEAEMEIPKHKTTTGAATRPTLQQPEWSQRHLMEQQSLNSSHQPKLPPPVTSNTSDSLSLRRGLIKRGESVRGLVAYSEVKKLDPDPIETRQGAIQNDGHGDKNQNSLDESEGSFVQTTFNSSVNARIAMIESKIQSNRMNLSPQKTADPVTDEIQLLSDILESSDMAFSLNEEHEEKTTALPEACPAARPPDTPECKDANEAAPKLTQASILISSENTRTAPRMQSSRHLLMTQGSFDSRMPKRASSHRNLFPQRSFDSKGSAASKETTTPPPNSLAARRGLIKRGESVRGLMAVSSASDSIKDTIVEQKNTIEEDESEHNQNVDPTDMGERVNILKNGSELEPSAVHLLESDDTSVSDKEVEKEQPVEEVKEGSKREETLEETALPCPADFMLARNATVSRMAPRMQSSRNLQTQGSFDSRMPKRASSHRNLFPQKSFGANTTSASKETTTPPPITLAARRGLIKRGESVRGLMAFSAISESINDPVEEQDETSDKDEHEKIPTTKTLTENLDEEANDNKGEVGQRTTSENVLNDNDDSWQNAPTDAPVNKSKPPNEISLDSYLSPQSTLVHIDEMHLLTNNRLECDDSTLNSFSERAVELSVKSNMYSKYRHKLMSAGSVGSTCSPKPPAKTPSIQSPIAPSRSDTNVSVTQSTASGLSDAPMMPSQKESTPVVVRSSDWAHLVPAQLRRHQSFHQISSKISVPTSTNTAPVPQSTNETTAGDQMKSLMLEVVTESDSIHSDENDHDDPVKSVEHEQRKEETSAPVDIPGKVPTNVRIEMLQSETKKSYTSSVSAETKVAEERPNDPPAIYPQRSFEARRRPIEPPGGSFDASRLRRPVASQAPSSRQLVRRGLIARGHSVRVLTLLPAAAEPEPTKEDDVNDDDYAPLPSALTVESSIEKSPTPATPPIHHSDDDVPWEELMASLKKASDQLLFPDLAATADPYKSYVTLGHLSQNLMDCYGSPREEYFSPRKSPRKCARTLECIEVSEDGDDEDVYLETSPWGPAAPQQKTPPPPPPVLTRAAPKCTVVPESTPAVAAPEPMPIPSRTRAAPLEPAVVAQESSVVEITPAAVAVDPVPPAPPAAVVAEDKHRRQSSRSGTSRHSRHRRKGGLRHFLEQRRAQIPQPHNTMTIWTDEDRLDEDLESRIGDDGSTFLEI